MSLLDFPPEIIAHVAEYVLGMDENAPKDLGKLRRVHAVLNIVLRPVMERAKTIPFLTIIGEIGGPIRLGDLRQLFYGRGFGKFWAKGEFKEWVKGRPEFKMTQNRHVFFIITSGEYCSLSYGFLTV
jgi:hypothetical protein